MPGAPPGSGRRGWGRPARRARRWPWGVVRVTRGAASASPEQAPMESPFAGERDGCLNLQGPGRRMACQHHLHGPHNQAVHPHHRGLKVLMSAEHRPATEQAAAKRNGHRRFWTATRRPAGTPRQIATGEFQGITGATLRPPQEAIGFPLVAWTHRLKGGRRWQRRAGSSIGTSGRARCGRRGRPGGRRSPAGRGALARDEVRTLGPCHAPPGGSGSRATRQGRCKRGECAQAAARAPSPRALQRHRER